MLPDPKHKINFLKPRIKKGWLRPLPASDSHSTFFRKLQIFSFVSSVMVATLFIVWSAYSANTTIGNSIATSGSLTVGGASSLASLTLSGTLNASSTAQITGTTTIYGLTNLSGFISSASSTIANSLKVTGDLRASSSFQSQGNVRIYGDLFVEGTTNLSTVGLGNSTVNGNQTVTGDVFINGGDLNLGTGLATSTLTSAGGLLGIGTTSPSQLLSVQGNVFLSGNISNVANITATGTLNVTGVTTLTNASTTGMLTVGNGFISNSSSTIASIFNVSGPLNASSTLSVLNLATLGGGYVSVGSSTVTAQLNVSGPVSASSTLSVANLATLGGGFIATASSTISNSLQLAGPLSASSTLNVGGLANLSGLISSASSTVNAQLNVSGPLSASSTLNVGGLANLSGFISNASSTISSNFLISGVLNASSSLAVAGGSSFAGNLTFNPSATTTVTFSGTGGINWDSNTFVIDAGGNKVGIGTSSPTEALSIAGNISNLASRSFNPTLRGSASTDSSPRSVYVSGRYAYVVNYTGNTLQIFDVSTSTPAFVSSASTGSGGPFSIHVSGRYAYVGNSDTNTFQIFDISNSSAPVSVSTTSTMGSQYIYVSGRYVYAVGGTNFQIFDVTNPAYPVPVSIASITGSAVSVQVIGRYAYISNSNTNGSLQIFDVANPASPVLLSTTSTSDGAVTIFVSGQYVYLVEGTTLRIFDVDNPAAPISVGTVTTDSSPRSIYVSGRYAYLGSSGTFETFDVGNPSAPVLVGSASAGTSGGSNVKSLFVAGRYAYLVNNTSNTLQIFDVSGIETTSAIIHSLETGSLQIRNDLITNGYASILTGLSVGHVGILSSGPLGISATTSQSSILGGLFIGTSTPATTSPNASSFFSSTAVIEATSSQSIPLTIRGAGTQTGNLLQLQSSDNSNVFFINSSGGFISSASSTISSNLLISGPLSASSTLNVGGLANLSGFISNASSTISRSLHISGNLQASSTASIQTLFVNGNAGFGTTTPGSLLSVQGNGLFSGTLSAANLIATGTITVTGTSGTSTIGSLTIGPDGRIGIGTTTPNFAAFEVATRTSAFNSGGDGSLGVWATSSNSLPASRYSSSAVTANGYVYVIGGSNGSNPQSTIYYAKINSDGSLGAWATNANALPVNLELHSSITANGYIYVIGGNSGSAQATVYYAKINSDGSLGAWATNANALPVVTDYHSSVAANGYVYVIGGTSTGSNAVYYAKINSDGSLGVWASANILPATRFQHSSITANGYVYVIGGSASGATTVYYAKINSDGSLGAWATNANALPAARKDHSSIVANGYVYVISGYDGTNSYSTVYYSKINSDGSLGAWATNANALPAVRRLQSSIIANGYVYVIGGYDGATVRSTVFYASTARVSILGNLDLLGLASTTLGDVNSSDWGSVGGSIFAGNIFSAGNLEVTGNANFYNSVGINGLLSIRASTSGIQTASIFSIQNATGSSPLFSIFYNGGFITHGSSTIAGTFNVSGLANLSGFISNASSTISSNFLISGVLNASSSLAVANGGYFGGNLGIGTTSPSSLFSVQGNGLFSGNLSLANLIATGTITVTGTSGTSTIGSLTIGPSGVIGIGTTTPNYANFEVATRTSAFNSGRDGSLGVWAATGTSPVLPAVRRDHTSVTANGYVYVIGGSDGSNTQTTVYYAKINSNGSLGTWLTNANALPLARQEHSSVTANGYVYVIGGGLAGTLYNSTIYYAKINGDGSLGAWAINTNVVPAARAGHSSVTANGYVYVIGGSDLNDRYATVYYSKINSDGSLGTSTPNVNLLPATRDLHSSFIANGYVYVIGGDSGASTVYYAKINNDGSLGAWATNANALPAVRRDHTSVVANGYAYVIGGRDSSGTNAFQATIYYAKINSDGSLGAWATDANALPSTRSYHSSIATNGYVYVIGGSDTNTTTASTVFYASTARVSILGNLDLLGLASTTLGDVNSGDWGSVGGSIFAGNIFSAGNLEVTGNANFYNSVGINGLLSVRASTSAIQTASIFSIQNATGTQPLFNVVYDGRVGIGTSTPWGRLSVEMRESASSTPAFVVSNQGSSSPAFYVGGVNEDGRIGVGSSTPWGRFSIEMDTTNPAFVVSNNGSSTPSLFIGGLNQNGFVGIGTTSLSVINSYSPALAVQGNLHVSGTTTSGGLRVTIQTFTSGSGTYTTPSGVAYIRVRLVGGGGGGQGSGTSPGTGENGGDTTFGSLTAGGGPGSSGSSANGGTASGGDINVLGGTGQPRSSNDVSVFGGNGGASYFGGGGWGGDNGPTAGGVGQAFGSGGGGAGAGGTAAAGQGGAAGGYSEKVIANPAATYSYSVGAAGAGGIAGTSGVAGGAGKIGIIIVEEYY